jgi:hypothetical protein
MRWNNERTEGVSQKHAGVSIAQARPRVISRLRDRRTGTPLFQFITLSMPGRAASSTSLCCVASAQSIETKLPSEVLRLPNGFAETSTTSRRWWAVAHHDVDSAGLRRHRVSPDRRRLSGKPAADRDLWVVARAGTVLDLPVEHPADVGVRKAAADTGRTGSPIGALRRGRMSGRFGDFPICCPGGPVFRRLTPA